jgi:hypothetical protein
MMRTHTHTHTFCDERADRPHHSFDKHPVHTISRPHTCARTHMHISSRIPAWVQTKFIVVVVEGGVSRWGPP